MGDLTVLRVAPGKLFVPPRNVAVHEAGHVVASVDLGFYFLDVTVLPDPQYSGCVLGIRAPRAIDPSAVRGYSHIRAGRRAALAKSMIVDLAGLAAEHKDGMGLSAAVKRSVGRGSDGEHFRNAMQEVAVDDLDLRRVQYEAIAETNRLVRRPEIQAAIQRIADALQEYGTLDFFAVIRITGCRFEDGQRAVWPPAPEEDGDDDGGDVAEVRRG